jgi:predicted unusual protein kinase regulating ubiquinone biosynthesis (AarF/ABC1/UbiB family)
MTQLDFEQEAKNTQHLWNCFKTNQLIVTPQVFDSSKRFIAMSFHDGQCVSSIKDRRLSFRISMCFYFFMLSSLLIHDFFHCDLHEGNCKVYIDGDTWKLIIYDCGIIGVVGDKSCCRNIIHTMIDNDFVKLTEIAMHESERTKNHDDFNQFVKELQNQYEIPATTRFRTIFQKMMSSGIKTDERKTRVLQGLIIGEKNIISVADKCSLILGPESNSVVWLYCYKYLCRAMNEFGDLYTYLDAWLLEEQNNMTIFHEWLDEKFGHTDVEVFYEVLSEVLGVEYKPYDDAST